MKKKVLLYSARFPNSRVNADGGSSTVLNVIEAIKKECILDVAFLNLDSQTFFDANINRFFYYNEKLPEDKFKSVFYKKAINKKVFENYRNYDLIVTFHPSNLFGLDDYGDDFWNKVVLFPMFLTPSYLKSGEEVPDYYIEEEKAILLRVKKFITPSIIEKEEMSAINGIDESFIYFIPRGVSPIFKYHYHKINDRNNISLCMVGTIKKQKNYLRALRVMSILKDSGINPSFHIAGAIQDSSTYKQLLSYINKHKLASNIVFHFNLSQAELNNLFSKCHFAVSTSNWETFGRGIYEGLCSGKPTFVFTTLEEVKKIVGKSNALVFCDDERDMANRIIYLRNHYEELLSLIESEINRISKLVSIEKEEKELRNVLLGYSKN